jgi:uncharacterized protein YjbI with pentapeptide repeats
MPGKIRLRPYSPFANWLVAGLLSLPVAGCTTAASTPPPVTARTVLAQLAGHTPVLVENVTFTDDLDFTTLPSAPETETVARVWIDTPVYFRNCIFTGNVLAFRQKDDKTVLCAFGRNLTFINCRFNAATRFQSVSVAGIGCFSRSYFNKPVSFEGAHFGAEAYFDNTLFATEARFQQATFGRLASFWKSVWAGASYFQGAVFQGDAQFNLADIRANLDFSLCTTYGLLNVNYATLTGRSNFDDCRFRNAVDFGNATLTDASLKGAFFESKALFTNLTTGRLSLENAYFLTTRPVIDLADGAKPDVINLTGARLAPAGSLLPVR